MAKNIKAMKRGWNYDKANTRLSCYVDGLEAIRLTPSTTGVDVRMLGDIPASYYFDWDASGPTLTIPSGVTLSLASGSTLSVAGTLTATDKIDSAHYAANSIDKEHLASEIYTIENVALAGSTNDFDNQTVKLYRCWNACTVVRVAYFTSASLGTGAGIDIIDGGTAGSGTDNIDSCSDALSGSDVNSLTTPYALSAGDYINVTFDDVDASVDFTIVISLKVPLTTAT